MAILKLSFRREEETAMNETKGQRNSLSEATNSKPLLMKIYRTVFVGVLVSFFYVFSTNRSSPCLFPSPLSRLFPYPQANATLELPVALPLQPQSKSLSPNWVPPQGKKMPPLESFRLTKELVEKRVKDNIIIVTFGNFAFMDFILNWVKHLTDLGLSNILVGAMDMKLLEALYWKGIPVFDMGSNLSTIDVGWGSREFHKMGREKVFIINAILPYGYELLMCDTDMVWLKNPLPYLARYPDADILTSTDKVELTVADDSLEIWQKVGAVYNIGIFHWRPTESAKKLAKEWKEKLIEDEKLWDQRCFNEIMMRQIGPSVDENNQLFYAYDGNLKVGILPTTVFCSGHSYFVQASYRQLRLEPYAVHTTFQYSGTAGKRHRLREAMFFYDPPEYYDAPGGFLSFKLSIPKSLLFDGEHNIHSHMALINHQIKQIRSAFAIASILNRTLIMPPIWCRLDRFWFRHGGILPGSLTRQPFLCPLDHVFQVNVMLTELPEEEFGPGIGFREYSFLDNPLLPKHVKESWLDVNLCQEGTKGCEVLNNVSLSRVLNFPKRSNEERFKTIFSSFKHVKVIKFSSVQDAFTGFSNKEREEKFRRRMKKYVGTWCCLKKGTPKYVSYDMFWDEKPLRRPALFR